MPEHSSPVRRDPALASFLGLALGDAYGRPLEFKSAPRVYTAPAGPGHDFMWTDDTHMALYLAEAVRAHGPGPLDADRFGQCVGERFSDWLSDPLTPSTAPGNTCMAGVREWRRSGDWRTSGVATSDGCGAVMRICPLAVGFSGTDLVAAASIQASLTHGHPNAAEASVAASWLLRRLLEGAALTPALVEEAVACFSSGDWPSEGGSTAAALAAAVTLAADTRAHWLDDAAIPDGDGGWRAPSALGLAVAAALRWGVDERGVVTTEGFITAVDRAARISGDSDSVACLTGMLLGAAGGTGILPPDWLAALPQRDRITEAVDGLLPEPIPTTRAPTGTPDEVWVAVADLHGHPEHLDRLLAALDASLGRDYRLVTLGDYVDNGPDIPSLLDRLIALRAERPERFVPILGNHDLACIRALGWPLQQGPDRRWCEAWAARFWSDAGTPAAYGARSAMQLSAHMPASHQAFLRSLPWYHDTGEYLFVHAGMQAGPLLPQRIRLTNHILPDEHTWMPPQLRDKALSGVSDPAWDRVVVSGHTKKPAQRNHLLSHAPHILTDRRICLSGEVDVTGVLYAVELPSRRIWSVDRSGRVQVS